MDGPQAFGWGAWLWWVLASAVGGAVLSLVARPLSLAAGTAVAPIFGRVAAEATVGALAMGLVLLGVALGQALVLRGRVPWEMVWILAVTASGALGGAAILALFEAFGGVLGMVVGLVVGLMVLGTTHWLVLRGEVPAAVPLAVAGMVGVPAAFVGTALAGPLGFGAAYGAVTGVVLVWQMGA